VADTATVVPLTVAPLAGAVIVAVGAELSTVTFTAVDVVVLPAASLATAVKLCAPLETPVVFQEIEYGLVVAVPMVVAPSLKTTCVTPTLSVELADTVTVPLRKAPADGAVRAAVGGV
jgi:hypothetical protein